MEKKNQKSPFMKEWMAQADSPKEASTVKKMNVQSLLLSSKQMTHCFKEWTTPSGVLSLQRFDVSNRSS